MSQQDDNANQERFTVFGIMALFAARVLSLPAGEYVIHLDTRQSNEPRWRIGQAPREWEHPAPRQRDRNRYK